MYYDDSDFTSNEMCCACGGGETINNTPSCKRFASTPTTTTSTPMDILVPTSTLSTTTKTSRTTVRHKLTRRSSPRPRCAVLAEEVRLGPRNNYPTKRHSKIVAKTHQPNIWTHRISLAQCTTHQNDGLQYDTATFNSSQLLLCVCVVEVTNIVQEM